MNVNIDENVQISYSDRDVTIKIKADPDNYYSNIWYSYELDKEAAIKLVEILREVYGIL